MLSQDMDTMAAMEGTMAKGRPGQSPTVMAGMARDPLSLRHLDMDMANDLPIPSLTAMAAMAMERGLPILRPMDMVTARGLPTPSPTAMVDMDMARGPPIPRPMDMVMARGPPTPCLTAMVDMDMARGPPILRPMAMVDMGTASDLLIQSPTVMGTASDLLSLKLVAMDMARGRLVAMVMESSFFPNDHLNEPDSSRAIAFNHVKQVFPAVLEGRPSELAKEILPKRNNRHSSEQNARPRFY